MIKSVVKRIFILAAVIASFPLFANELEDLNSNIVEIVNTEIKESIKNKSITGAVVSVVSNGKTIFNKGFGYADAENGIIADPEKTAFRIGSISKTFVALSALQLEEKGLLDLDRSISDYLDKDFPQFESTITMRNLLTHTPGFEETGEEIFVHPYEEVKELKDILINNVPKQIYRSGEIYAYSNYGMALAGYVIECISGMNFDKYAEKYIFNSIGMYNTTFTLKKNPADFISKGYYKNGKEREEGLVSIYPAGSVKSTSGDMAKYAKYLLNAENSAMTDKLFRKQFSMDESFAGIGLSWFKNVQNGKEFYIHLGGTDNFLSTMVIFPDYDIAVFYSINTNDSKLQYEPLKKIVTFLYGEQKEPVIVSTDDKTGIPDISGTYMSSTYAMTTNVKFLNSLSGRRFEGDTKEGFSSFNKPVIYLGENFFFHPNLGKMKYLKSGNDEFLALEEGGVLVKRPFCESKMFIFLITGVFAFASIIIFIISLVMLLANIKRKEIWKIVISSLSIIIAIVGGIVIYTLVSYCSDMLYADIISFVNTMKTVSFILLNLTIIFISFLIVIFKRKKYIVSRIIFSLYMIPTILFLFLLTNWNFLF